MLLHAYLPSETPDQDAEEVVGLAVLAEKLGYHAVWAPDHPLPPFQYRDFYAGVWEPLILLSNVAARTSRIRLATGVLIPALRNPFVVAKQAATLDRLSGGRLELGLGIGFVPQEYANMGAEYRSRAARTLEIIALLRHLFRNGAEPFDGAYYPVGDKAVFAPVPVQGDSLPIWTGGRSPAAWRRAAQVADGWLCAMTEPDEFAANVQRMREVSDRNVRAGARILVTDPATTLDQAVETVETWRQAGTDDLIVWFGHPDGYADRMALFAEAFAKAGRDTQTPTSVSRSSAAVGDLGGANTALSPTG
jgi:probable F420-dependent oxidoreductase